MRLLEPISQDLDEILCEIYLQATDCTYFRYQPPSLNEPISESTFLIR